MRTGAQRQSIRRASQILRAASVLFPSRRVDYFQSSWDAIIVIRGYDNTMPAPLRCHVQRIGTTVRKQATHPSIAPTVAELEDALAVVAC